MIFNKFWNMTQENKDLLLKDLCARLPYGIKVSYYGAEEECETWDEIECVTLDGYVDIGQYSLPIESIKPYLFPLSSMTDEQKQYLKNRFCYDWDGEPYDLWKCQIEIGDTDELIDWFNKNHFDYRGLIEKNLAIDATNLNIY